MKYAIKTILISFLFAINKLLKLSIESGVLTNQMAVSQLEPSNINFLMWISHMDLLNSISTFITCIIWGLVIWLLYDFIKDVTS